MPLALPSTLRSLSHQQDIYLHTDDINMPAIPVRHTITQTGGKLGYDLHLAGNIKYVLLVVGNY
jgi:hypothetical protein